MSALLMGTLSSEPTSVQIYLPAADGFAAPQAARNSSRSVIMAAAHFLMFGYLLSGSAGNHPAPQITLSLFKL